MKNWIIKGNGYFNKMVNDPFFIGIEIADIEFGYGQIKFKGKESELEEFILRLMDDEANFKVIDYFEENSKEHKLYLYGPGDILKKQL